MRANRTKAQYQEAVSAISMALTMVFSVGLAIEREREREGGLRGSCGRFYGCGLKRWGGGVGVGEGLRTWMSSLW